SPSNYRSRYDLTERRLVLMWGLFGSRPENMRDSRRKYRCIRLLKTRQMANLRAFYDPIITGLSDETQFLDL
ncbi:hypothetical protein, partial [Pseudomonas fluorescens]|uniref:hypothetical protein n=1 Tax=Pseudomonas fluorescens TaxID=294 RepID=UPI001C83C522